MDLNKMNGESVSKPHRLLSEARSLFNNPELSDVRFLIDGQTVYGHKVILAMGSPAFKSMFFGDLKEKREEIEITDLSLVGFKNALRYIYGFDIDFELSELYESYLAADKYLLHDFGEAFFDYIKGELSAENSCLIYDQLIKIQKEEIPLADVRSMIIESSETFESEYFKQIDQETLISLLSLDNLSIAEIDLLAAVSKWVDCEMHRQGLPLTDENRRKVFEPIKGYILFTALKPEEIANREEIVELLTTEERGSLVLHLLGQKNPLMTELKTSRIAEDRKIRSVFVSDTIFYNGSYSRSMHLSVNQRVAIQTVHSTYSESAPIRSLTILNLNGVDLGLKMESLVKNGRLCFWFNPPFDVKPNTRYTLKFTGDGQLKDGDYLSQQTQLNYKESVIFDLAFGYDDYKYVCHCVSGLEFLSSD